MINTADLSSRIQGWGSDLDPARRPGVPKMKDPVGGTGAHWAQPEHQYSKVKIHQSIERPGLTPVFGTTYPPRGLSGRIRDYAYGLGEGFIPRWMLLLFADRVDVVEGLIEDVSQGKIANPIREMGWTADFKYNKTGVLKIVGVIGVGVVSYLAYRKLRERREFEYAYQ